MIYFYERWVLIVNLATYNLRGSFLFPPSSEKLVTNELRKLDKMRQSQDECNPNLSKNLRKTYDLLNQNKRYISILSNTQYRSHSSLQQKRDEWKSWKHGASFM